MPEKYKIEKRNDYQRRVSVIENYRQSKNEIIFLGHSQVREFPLEMYFEHPIINMGISGETTQGLYKNLYLALNRNPKKIFLLIGVNDILKGISNEIILKNYRSIINRILQNAPHCQLYICNILPLGKVNDHIIILNERIEQFAKRYDLYYIDLYGRFGKGGILKKEFDSGDGLHLNGEAYKVLAEYLKIYINKQSNH
ncbi:GDSL-type esterase/lipase family protein [Algibacter mikhailovii]|uniref:GDSL-type esterase/lipase family protein n=1 Tax=Algibacter mikhailovii TaxID=425498 RepID=UPI00249480FE|nr:GDSL-type esterase/lipase family protein [Algibacter mikhailovii]